MRRAIIAVLALAGCSSQGVQRIGPNQYIVTAPPSQVFAEAKEACAKVGRLIASASFPDLPSSSTATYVPPRYERLKVQCAAPYEVAAVSKDSYRIWVPTSEIPKSDPCPACVPSLPFGFPRLEVADERAKQRATEYCAKTNMAMKQTSGDFDIGTGLNVIFICVSKQN